MSKVNTIVPAANQIWQHITSNIQIIIVSIDGPTAYCALMNGPKVGKLKVAVPLRRFMNWGNRGLMHVRNRKGGQLKFKGAEGYSEFNSRIKDLGAK